MPKLLIIGFVWPEPKSSAAGSRMLQLIHLFLSQGYQITFASACSKTEKAFNLEALGVNQVVIKLNDSSFDNFISKLKPDVVLFDRFMIEEQFGWRVFDNCPEALRILDTEDLHSLRKGREQAYKDQKPFNNAYLFRDVAKREIASIYRCDLSLMISEAEISILKNEFGVPENLLHYLPFLIEDLKNDDIEKLPKYYERKHFVTIGNFLHPPNLDSVKFLKETVWPKIRVKLKDVEMHIYGAYISDKAKQYQDTKNRLFINGFAENVNDVLASARVCLSPLQFGAGLKGKFFDAMHNGTPFVTTFTGAEGIVNPDIKYDFISDSVDDIVNHAVMLYQNMETWQKQQDLGFSILSERFNKTIHSRRFLNRLENLIANKQIYRLQNFTGAMLNFHTMQSTKYMSRWIEEKNNIK